VELSEVQALMARTYGDRDTARGVPASIAWLCEEVGEFARAARKGSRDQQVEELGDVLAWLASIANQLGVTLEEGMARYVAGCPRCGRSPCGCPAA